MAREAAASWADVAVGRRAGALFRLRDLIERHADNLAALVTREHGKVRSDALGEVARGLDCVEFACGIPHLLKGTLSSEVSTGVDVHTVLEPVGVVAGITPFNFPVMVPLWMLANAVACGNMFVLKPSEKDPSPSLLLAELVQQAGVPDGVVTVLQGDGEAVDALLTSPLVDAVSFVGSTPIARHVYETGTGARQAGPGWRREEPHGRVARRRRDAAADAAISSGYGSAGERCMAISVVVAVGTVGDPLVDAIAARVRDVVVGPGDDEASMMGPLITREHRDRVRGYVDGAAAEGARVVVDGPVPPSDGFFAGCALLDHVAPGMRAYDDEIFGPVLSVVRVGTYDEAVTLVNGNPYGNGVAVFTRDGGVARRFEREVKIGMVGVNVPIPVPVASHSFGGWKASLFGDSAMYGPEGIRFYTRPKVVTSRWPEPESSAIDLGFPTNH